MVDLTIQEGGESVRLTDAYLKQAVLDHIVRRCDCAHDNSGRVPETMAQHIAEEAEVALETHRQLLDLAATIRGILTVLVADKRILTDLSGLSLRNAWPFQQQVRSSGAASVVAKPDRPSSDRPLRPLPHLEPKIAAFVLLYRVWLWENNGVVKDKGGHLATRFRTRFGLRSGWNTAHSANEALQAMEGAGEITRDVRNKCTYEIAWHRSELPPEIVDPREAVKEAVDYITTRTNKRRSSQPAGSAADNNPGDRDDSSARDEPAPITHPDPATSSREVLLAYADWVFSLLERSHALLWVAIFEHGLDKRAPIDAMALLPEDGIPADQAAAACWYLRKLGFGPTKWAWGTSWYWDLTEDPPSKSKVQSLIVDERVIYDPANPGASSEPTESVESVELPVEATATTAIAADEPSVDDLLEKLTAEIKRLRKREQTLMGELESAKYKDAEKDRVIAELRARLDGTSAAARRAREVLDQRVLPE